MSRSRRPRRLRKCCCGRHEIPVLGFGRPYCECTVLGYVHERNERFLKYREQRSLPMTEED